ncbi:hypothetical protein [Methylobacterium planeticum]|uniref:Uncharacterized protein n=1 Tax=Methylobacterium planeticum TaxID=2615211 RepID=A0A6N6ML39_9HYPH|nr:hypothetical protein [Methylobacterium planeticum]KAB1070425.1 hypothetical protein F6X51_22895 [Methylobacterium planeticum]
MAQNIQPDRPIWPSVPETGHRSGRGSFEGDTPLDREGAHARPGLLPQEPQAPRMPAKTSEGFGSFEG